MRAVTWQGNEKMEVKIVPDPTIANQMAAWFNAFHGSNKLLIEINDLFELWKLNAVLDLS